MTIKPETQAALKRYLLTVADDELALGMRDAEWTGIAPIIEEDVAFSSLAQDELGHARLAYMLVAEMEDSDADFLAYLRPKNEYYHARLLEARLTVMYDPKGHHTGEVQWAKAIVRRFLYDLFDNLRTESLLTSSYTPIANAFQKVYREEKYHLWHGETWWKTLSTSSATARTQLEEALTALWPDVLGLFEEAPGEALLQAEGIIASRTSQLLNPWLEHIQPLFAQYNLPFPASKVDNRWQLHVQPAYGGRQGQHGAGWDELYTEMTMVRQLEPEGVW